MNFIQIISILLVISIPPTKKYINLYTMDNKQIYNNTNGQQTTLIGCTQQQKCKTKLSQQKQQQQYEHQIGFAIDIDGTLVLSHQQIPGASQALNLLNSHNIPHIFVTNNISKSQQTKADELNTLFKNKLTTPITADQMILNITPLKTYMNWSQKIILIIIRQNQAKDRLPFQQIPYYITIDQYCTIFPNTVPLSRRKMDQHALAVKKRVLERLTPLLKHNNNNTSTSTNLDINHNSTNNNTNNNNTNNNNTNNNLDTNNEDDNILPQLEQNSLKFGAILVVNCPVSWEQSYQVIIDLLSSQDGSLHQINDYKYIQNHIPILTALNDLCFRTKYHPLPRVLIKPFNQGLKSIYKAFYGQQLKLLTFGKPQANTFQFTKKVMQKKYGKVKKIVMIGDNQDTDIKGAYNFGWESILVLVGVTKHQSKLATHNCKSIIQGLNKYGILQKN